MKQIVIIHGGNSYNSYDEYMKGLTELELEYDWLKYSRGWKDAIAETFTDTDILKPDMPNSANAQYSEWKIWFEKIIPFFQNDVRLIGHSLGAMFLAKYLHESPLERPVRQLILLAGGYDDATVEGYGSFALTSATGVEKSADKIHLMHSRDDFVVPFSELAKYQADLPTAQVHEFDNRNHFLDAEFPELIEILQQ